MKKQHRRVLAAGLIVLGALLMWFATENVGGLVLIGIGVLVEIVGIALEKRT